MRLPVVSGFSRTKLPGPITGPPSQRRVRPVYLPAAFVPTGAGVIPMLNMMNA